MASSTRSLAAGTLPIWLSGARDGRFTLKGSTSIAGTLGGQVARLLGPVTDIDMAADVTGRRMAISGGISSDALTLDSKGTVDLGESRFETLDLALVVSKPAALADNLSAAGLRGNFTLDGKFSEPQVNYNIAASHIGLGDIGLDRFRASGEAQVDAEGYLVPLQASAGRITGLDSLAGGTLTDVRLGGNLAVQGARVLSDDLRLRSQRIDATLTLVADLSQGTYLAGINGQLNDYRLDGVGIFAIDSKLDVKSAPSGGFLLEGQVLARSSRVTNDSIASFLGGNFLVGSDVRYGTDGSLALDRIRLEAPLLRISDGRATMSENGVIAMTLNGVSENYGQVGFQMAGTIADPQATLTAEKPDFGIGLADVTADITGSKGVYLLDARGSTDYGPLTARVGVDTADRLAIDIQQADLGGIGFTGGLRQTAEGPFAGRLLANGRGLGGVVQLDSFQGVQRAVFNLRANNMRLDGRVGLRVGSAIVDGSVVLFEQPRVKFDAQLSSARFGNFALNAGRARVDYRDGAGQAQLVMEGSRAFPFRLAANARLQPDLWQATLKGRIRGIDVATQGSARVVPGEGTYELLPTRISIGDGSMQLAGKYGDAILIQSRLEDVDLAMANAFMPNLGLGGKASGSLDFAQSSPSAFPRADARLKISNFSRTTAFVVSNAVDINFVGKLLSDGGEARAVFRQGNDVIGRLSTSLRPLGPGAGSWNERLMGAPLSGGIRYNGPAATLFSLTGQTGQSLTGAVGIAADFSGRLRDPRIAGVIRATNLVYEYGAYGTRLTNLAVTGRFAGENVELDKVTAKAGDGTVEAQGRISLSAEQGFPMDLDIDLANARLARGEPIAATATGKLKLTKVAGETALLSGSLTLPETRYKLVREGEAEVPHLSGVQFKPRRGRQRITGNEPAEAEPGLFERVRLDIALAAPGRFYVSGMGLESEWRADLTVKGTNAEPLLIGSVDLVRGSLDFASRSFTLEEGHLQFDGQATSNPRIAITAREDVEDISVLLGVSGRAMSPQISFSSVPGLPQDEIIARILFGSSVANLSAIQGLQLAASLNSLRGTGGGLNPLGTLRSATGIDRLRILDGDETTGRGTSIAAGKYLTDDIYLEIITDARGFTATQVEISLTPALSILSQAGGSGTSDVSIQYRKNY